MNINKKMADRISLIVVLLFSLIITITIVYENIIHQRGIGTHYKDVYCYLIESLRLAGIQIGGYKFVNYFPPFIPFLTSLLFRIGFVSEYSILFTAGIFHIFGIIGMYYILKLRFNNYYSIFGSIVYGAFLINLKWVGNGMLDIPFTALMIWAIYFFILAMEKNQNYFYIAIPLAVISFFTKYPAGVIFPLMLLYFMAKTRFFYNIKKYSKGLVKGAIAGVITLIPFLAYFVINKIPLGFINQAQEISSRAYQYGKIILAIFIIGLIVTIYFVVKNFKDSFSKIKNSRIQMYKWDVSSKIMYLIFAVSIILILISFFTASLISFIISEIILFIGLYLCAYSYTKIFLKYDNVDDINSTRYPYLLLNIIMIGFFLSYFVFFSAHLIKLKRYFISLVPGFVFLITLSIETLIIKMKDIKIRNINLKQLIPLFIILLMLISSIQYIDSLKDDKNVIDEKNAANWIKDKDGIIMSDRGPAYTFYLKKEIKHVKGIKQERHLDEKLLDNDADYFIGINPVNLTYYSPIKEFGNVTVYQRNDEIYT